MPKLKLMVESALHRYLTDELTDEGFKKGIQLILNEFKGKNLLHQNIGQLTWRMETENPSRENKFERIWIVEWKKVQVEEILKQDTRYKNGGFAGDISTSNCHAIWNLLHGNIA